MYSTLIVALTAINLQPYNHCKSLCDIFSDISLYFIAGYNVQQMFTTFKNCHS